MKSWLRLVNALSLKLRQKAGTFRGVPAAIEGQLGIDPEVSPHDGASVDAGSTPAWSTYEKEMWVRKWVPSLWFSDQLGKEAPNEYDENRDLVPLGEWNRANLVGSVVAGSDPDNRLHGLVIDVDHPMTVVPSTQPDHGHLYVTLPRPVEWDLYLAWLEASAAIGLISRNYLRHCKVRKSSMVRLPWVKKQPKLDPRTGAATFGWVGMSSEGEDEE